jgi:hypothetical protein
LAVLEPSGVDYAANPMLVARLPLILSLLRLAQTAHQLREPAGEELFRCGELEDLLHDLIFTSHPVFICRVGD